MTTLLSTFGIMCMILAVGAIDGPTPELAGDNFALSFVFAIIGVLLMLLAIKFQKDEE
tara:strand:- start:612 stop:785 length:174 start_codon:yes stop_codon:yes gene_type:complete